MLEANCFSNTMSQLKSDTLVFFVNGKKVEDSTVDPSFTLLRYLREKLLLPGTKYGCGEGGCGACTVMVSKLDRDTGNIRHFSVNACLTLVCSLHGHSVTTTEGIGSTKTRLHPVQERLAKAHGSQCGFCTPGFVMSMYALLRNNSKPNMDEIEETLVGNLCRCTGYRPILEGFRTFTERPEFVNGCDNGGCCKMNGFSNGGCCKMNDSGPCYMKSNEEMVNVVNDGTNIQRTAVLFDAEMFVPHDPSQEVIFPPDLKLHPEIHSQSLVFKGSDSVFFRPATLMELLSLKQKYPEAKIVVGNTEVGVEVKFKNQHYPVIIHPPEPELSYIMLKNSYIEVGAATTLSKLETSLKNIVRELPEYKAKVLHSILEMLRWFAGKQIRNVAALGGNIMTGSPISDMNPILMAAGTKLTFESTDGKREVDFDDKFFSGYRKNITQPKEVLTAIKIPLTSENEYFKSYKQARRRDDDIAIVNAAMKVSLEPKTMRVLSAFLVFGGMAPTMKMATQTMKILRGSVWNKTLLERGTETLLEELRLDPSTPGGMVDYRLALTASFFFKFYLSVCQDISIQHPGKLQSLTTDEEALIKPYQSLPVKSTQFFQNVPEGQEKIDPVGRPIIHVSSIKQATGEATYIDDIPHYENELSGALVVSNRAHAKIININESDALKLEGVEAFLCARDVPGENMFGPILRDDEIFATSKVGCIGQVIGLVVAQNHTLAQKAARMVQVTYEDLPNPIFTLEQAIAANSMWDPISVDCGNTEEGFKRADFVLKGESYMGGQEHFYLETNAHLALPHEGDEIEIISSTQNLTGTQEAVARALGISSHLVTAKVKRIGGGFGGKETRTIAASVPIAIAAAKFRRPVRLVLERDEDMLITAGRHPFLGRWKVGFSKTGKLEAVDMKFYCNGGYSLDLSAAVAFRAVFSAENVYKIKNMNVVGYPCKTNLPSNTAFRGFGTPQGCFVMEDIIEQVADHLHMESRVVREMNMYSAGDTTPYGQELTDSNMRRCWNHVIHSGNFEQRRNKVDLFNSNSRYKKRGLSLTPSKFPVAFGLKFMNQTGALVLVYKDGSVLISHGGMEMGQGLHTKMIQVASRVLGVPLDTIYVAETSTDKVPNTSPTAASSTADVSGMAVLNSCQEIIHRLAPYKKKLPLGCWKDWVIAAYMDRVSLAVSGFYKTPHLETYCPFNYFTYGASISEVEIDCLTGDHTVLRTDIVMDIGTSLNPAIDIGQIEGAFMQGYGLFTIEQLVYSQSGALITKGPGSYKIPSVQDIPREFNVSLLRDSSNPRAVYSSKAVGEPPLFSGASVFFALRDAVKAARSDHGKGPLYFNSPATVERIRMSCQDHITEQIDRTEKKSARSPPWSLNI